MRLLKRLAIVVALLVSALNWSEIRRWYNRTFTKETASADSKLADSSLSPSAAGRAAELVREYSSSLVFVEGKNGKGSAFVCLIGPRKFIISNQHVIAGNENVTLTLLDRSKLNFGQASAAVGHDVVAFSLLSDSKAMEVLPDVEKRAAIGDEVVVLGNQRGSGVIEPLVGKLMGIGPDRVEVSAPFVPGNSGSPVIHLKTGKVIGVATYAIIRKVDPLTRKPLPTPEVKRFAYRLDSITTWEPILWSAYHQQFQILKDLEARSKDIINLILSKKFRSTDYNDSSIRHSLERYINATNGKGLIKTDDYTAVTDLASSLRSACFSDINAAHSSIRYDFFRTHFAEEQELRNELYREFDGFLKRLPVEGRAFFAPARTK